MFSVEFYRRPNGESPMETFMNQLDPAMKAKTLSVISLLKENGNMLREPFSTHIDKGIFELRVKVGNDINRIFYFFRKGKVVLLTNGYIKKSQKMDKGEYEKALFYKRDYEMRYERSIGRG